MMIECKLENVAIDLSDCSISTAERVWKRDVDCLIINDAQRKLNVCISEKLLQFICCFYGLLSAASLRGIEAIHSILIQTKCKSSSSHNYADPRNDIVGHELLLWCGQSRNESGLSQHFASQ